MLRIFVKRLHPNFIYFWECMKRVKLYRIRKYGTLGKRKVLPDNPLTAIGILFHKWGIFLTRKNG